jgi:hypothetical protein
VKLKNVSGIKVEIPALRVVVPPDGTFDCPDDIAGETPGGWREPTPAEAAENCRGLVTRTKGGTTLEVRSPGSGLLATGNYEPAVAPAPAKKTAAASPTDTSKEGE